MTRILLVEDDDQITSYLGELLRAEGFDTQIAGSKKEAGECLLAQAFDLVLLDVSLPDGNGFSICAEIKREYEIPVIFLTASGDEYSVVAGLDMGADDYLVKPFGMMEMVSRIKAVLRRCMPKKENKTVYVNGIIEMNVEEHTVSVSGESICLTYKEYEILKIFLMHPGMAYTRNRLLSEVWGIDSYGESRTVDMHIKTLRQKLGDGGRYIVTVRNVGYKMEVHND